MQTFLRFLLGGLISAGVTISLCFGLMHGLTLLGLPEMLLSLVQTVFVMGAPPLAIIIGLLGGVQFTEGNPLKQQKRSPHYFVG